MHRNVLCSSSLNDLKAELISNEQSLLNDVPPAELLSDSILRPPVDFNNFTQFDLDQIDSVCYNLNNDAVTTNMKNEHFFHWCQTWGYAELMLKTVMMITYVNYKANYKCKRKQK